jgi:hypothetical protein
VFHPPATINHQISRGRHAHYPAEIPRLVQREPEELLSVALVAASPSPVYDAVPLPIHLRAYDPETAMVTVLLCFPAIVSTTGRSLADRVPAGTCTFT